MKEFPRSVLPRGAIGKQRRNGSTARRKDRFVYALQEGRTFRRGKAVLVLISNRLILIIMRAANGRPFDFAGLTGDGLAFLRGVILSHGLGADFVQPDITELVVRLFAFEAHREIGRLVGGRADEHAIGVDLVGEDHLLNDQRQISQLRLERQFGIRIQNVAFLIAIGKEDLLR